MKRRDQANAVAKSTANSEAKQSKTRVAVVHSQAMMRMGLGAFLNAIANIDVVIEADSADAALAQLPSAAVDVMVIDLQLPNASGIDLVSQVKRHYPRLRLLMITGVEEAASIAMAQQIGAHGLITKRRLIDDIGVAMKALIDQRSYWPDIASVEVEDSQLTSVQPLSPRELEVLTLIGSGKSSKEIARVLAVSVRTIDVHRANIKRKLRVKNTSELVKYAVVLATFGNADSPDITPSAGGVDAALRKPIKR